MPRMSERELHAGLSRMLSDWSAQDAAALEEYAGVSQAVRDQAVKKGWALSDGSYPVMNVGMLKAAATLAASKHGNWKAALSLVRRRAKDLGVKLTSLPGFGEATAAAEQYDGEVLALINKALALQEQGGDPNDPNDRRVLGLLKQAQAAQKADIAGDST